MQLLVSVSPYVPQRSAPYAGHQWYFHFLEAMASRYDVVVLAPATAENEAALAGTPAETRLLPGLGHWQHSELQRNSLDKLSDELLRGVIRFGDGADDVLSAANVVDIQWPRALPHVTTLRARASHAVVTYLAHDVHYMNWSWERLSALGLPKRIAGWEIGRLVRRRELSLMGNCDALFAFKQSDIDDVRAAGVTKPAARLAPWLERPVLSQDDTAESNDVLFVAAFDRAQNRWGAEWLLEKVWPAVKAEVPAARLVLAGGGAPVELTEAARRSDGAAVTGFVEDLGPLYEQAGCIVAPVLGGAGLRFKVPQAMAYGRPLVVTPLALEGLDAPAECFVAVTDDPPAFARGVVASLRRSPEAEKAAVAASSWLASALSFDRSMEAVLELHERLAARENP